MLNWRSCRYGFLVVLCAAALAGCAGSQPVANKQPATLSDPTTSPTTEDDFGAALDAIFAPPPESTEIAPGLFAHAIFSVWYPGRGEKRPGPADVKKDEIRFEDRPEFAVTVLFFRKPDSKGGTVRYRESLTLPAKADWPDESDHSDFPEPVRPRTTISADGRTCVTEQTVALKEGQLIPSFNDGENTYILYPFPSIEWGVAEDDPPGDWRIEASINDKPLLRQTFKVTIPPRDVR